MARVEDLLHDSLTEQREERPRADAAEEQEVELHRGGQSPQRRIGRAALRDLLFGGGPRPRIASACTSGAARPTASRRRAAPARHRALGHPDEDVLDEPADDWRVVRGSGRSGIRHPARPARVRECRAAGSGDPTCAGAPAGGPRARRGRAAWPGALIQRRPDGDAARSCGRAYRRTARRRARARARPRASMPRNASGDRCSSTSSENAFVNVPSPNGRRRRSPSSRSTSCLASREKKGAMSIPVSRAPQSRFHSSVRPLPHPRSTTRSRRRGGQECPQHVVADPRSQQRRRRPLVTGVGVQRLVQVLRLLVERIARPEIEKVRRCVRICAAASRADERRAVAFGAKGRAAVGTANEREQVGGDHRLAVVTVSKSASSRPALRSQP